MSHSEQVGKGGFWRRHKESEPDAPKDAGSNGSLTPGSVLIAPAAASAAGAPETGITTASTNGTSQTSTATSRSLADETKAKGTKMEIDTLNGRIKELESTLAAERQAFDKQRQEFLTRPKLEDLGPEDLATESLGAVSEIIKAARAQSTELKRAASEELARAEEEATALRASAAAAADEMRRESERLAGDVASKAKAKQEKLISDSKVEAQRTVDNAKAAAEKLLLEAQVQRDSIIEEAQTRLESATNRSRKAVENANATAQATLDAARVGAARAREEARVTANETLKQCMSSTDNHYQSLKELKVELQAMELAFANFSTPLVNSLQLLKTDLSKIFQQADNAALVADQSRSDLALSLEQSSSVVTATNVVSMEVPSTVTPEVVGAEPERSAPAAKQPAGALAGGK
jgi:hypothetical protein